MTQNQTQLKQLAQDCRMARAAKLRKFIIRGYKLSDLCLIQYHGFPSFRLDGKKNPDGSYTVTCKDKFDVTLVKHLSEEEKEQWCMGQYRSGLWYDWRGQRRKRSWEV